MPAFSRWLPTSSGGNSPVSPAAAAAFLAFSAAVSTWRASTGEGTWRAGSAAPKRAAPEEWEATCQQCTQGRAITLALLALSWSRWKGCREFWSLCSCEDS